MDRWTDRRMERRTELQWLRHATAVAAAVRKNCTQKIGERTVSWIEKVTDTHFSCTHL